MEAAQLGTGAMFDTIAKRYDLLNRLMSFGVDRRWRRHTVAALGLRPGHRVLDLATGTADVALEVLRQEPGAVVVGVDPSPAMLEIGRAKVAACSLTGSIELVEGDAQEIPFPDASFDGVSMAFGIRNVKDRPRALREMARVTRPGGRVCILELGEPPQGPLGWVARVHVHWAIPKMGALLSGRHAYAYLQESIARFPGPPEFEGMLDQAGLSVTGVTSFSFGACSLFVAEVPGARA